MFFLDIGLDGFISFEKTSVGWILIHLLPQSVGALSVPLRIVEGEGSQRSFFLAFIKVRVYDVGLRDYLTLH